MPRRASPGANAPASTTRPAVDEPRDGHAYHHGDLAQALIAAGFELARAGGPDALSLREVTRSVGVTPNAAYRHFADHGALVTAVAARAQEQVALTMEARMEQVDPDRDPADRAVARLRAVGLGYIEFARAEPGLFQLAFRTHDQFAHGPDPDATGEAGAPPFQLLVAALDDLVTAGVLPPERRAGAEWACWSAVHGLSDLATRGPLTGADPAQLDELARGVVERAVEGVVGRVLS